MSHGELVELIRQHGVATVGRAMHSVPDQLQHGWDLTTWSMQQVPGAVLFFRLRDSVVTGEPRVLCVNAPAAERATWEALAAEADAPVVLLLAPAGHVA